MIHSLGGVGGADQGRQGLRGDGVIVAEVRSDGLDRVCQGGRRGGGAAATHIKGEQRGRWRGRRKLANAVLLGGDDEAGALPLPAPAGIQPVALPSDLIQLGGGALAAILGEEVEVDVVIDGLSRPLLRTTGGGRGLLLRFLVGIRRARDIPLHHPPEHAVPAVLDGVVRPPVADGLGDPGPLAPHRLVRGHDGIVLGPRPRPLVDGRVEVVVPSLAALLAQPAGVELFRQEGPAPDAVLLDEFDEAAVLVGRPRPLDEAGTEDLLPPVEALDVGPVGEAGGDLLPVSRGVGGNGGTEDGVLGFGPLAVGLGRGRGGSGRGGG